MKSFQRGAYLHPGPLPFLPRKWHDGVFAPGAGHNHRITAFRADWASVIEHTIRSLKAQSVGKLLFEFRDTLAVREDLFFQSRSRGYECRIR